MQIGLLEDDIAIQEMLRMVLHDEGYALAIYSTAEECLNILLTNGQEHEEPPIDLLIVDLRLSRAVLGTEVIRQIREEYDLRALPIILTTGATLNDIEDLPSLDVTLLPKPFDVDEVVKLIKDLTTARPENISSSFP